MMRWWGLLLILGAVLAAAPVESASLVMGETAVLTQDNSGDGNLLVAWQVVLTQTATLQSLSFYVTTTSGTLRLGVYDTLGSGPGTLKAQTESFTPSVGWNTQPVSPVVLNAGTYWLVYFPSSSNLHFRSEWTGGSARWVSRAYGAMPAQFPSGASMSTARWSLYATLSEAAPAPVDGAPGAPTIRLAQIGGVKLEWDAPTTNTDGTPLKDLGTYRVYWGPLQTNCPGLTYQSLPSPTPEPKAGDIIEWQVNGLIWDQEYKFQVTAVDLSGNESPCSTTVTGKPKY